MTDDTNTTAVAQPNPNPTPGTDAAQPVSTPAPMPPPELSHEEKIAFLKAIINDFTEDISKTPSGFFLTETGMIDAYSLQKTNFIKNYMTPKYRDLIFYAVQPELREDMMKLLLAISNALIANETALRQIIDELQKSGAGVVVLYHPLP